MYIINTNSHNNKNNNDDNNFNKHTENVE